MERSDSQRMAPMCHFSGTTLTALCLATKGCREFAEQAGEIKVKNGAAGSGEEFLAQRRGRRKQNAGKLSRARETAARAGQDGPGAGRAVQFGATSKCFDWTSAK
jgi:hypothetical protein